MAAQIQRGVPQSQLSPKYLHTNSTSHTWPFSAIAELIDNAYDPDVRAKQFWIDKTLINDQDCLTFMDNGNGLNYEKMHKMLSFGYSDKKAINGHVPIGLYGNGFKSGSMRLGKDALVFSKSRDVMSVGMLSQTYLDKIKAEQIIVPIVTFQRISDNNPLCVCEKHKASLKEILTYSLFKTEEELHTELGAINSTCSTGSTGTRIIIWNLRRTSTGTTEFELNDRYDIQIPSDVYETTKERYKRPERFTQSIPESDYSLRAYCSILYLKPWMQIIIRGQKVKTQLISKSLAYIAKDHYKPTYLPKRVPITFGYNTKSKDQYGIMMYHKNRLIKAYERLGCQLKANVKGLGVIGVIECNFLEPTHNKQDFDNTDKYRNTMNSLAAKLEDYWKEILHKKAIENPKSTTPVEDTMKRPDQNWVQCDTCLQWRKLPDGIDFDRLPEKWFCHMNPDPQFRSCKVEEEPEDSDDDQPSYQKTYKQKEKMDKMVQERQRQQLEERQKQEEEKRLALLVRQNEALMLQQDDLTRQLGQTVRAIAHSPAAPDTPKARVKSPRGGARSSTRTQAEPSPSSDAMPVISNVFTLSTPSRMKRTQSTASRRNSKRPRLNVSKAHDELESASPEASQSSPVDDDDDDDDIVVLETTSTPRPRRPSFDLATVKQESCSDEAALVTRPEASTATTGSSRETAAMATSLSPPTTSEMQQVGVTTQTELPNIKNEEEKKKKGSNEREGGREGEQVNGDAHPEAQNPRQENRGSPAEDREEDADQSSSPAMLGTDAHLLPSIDLQSMSKVQEQQDGLLELMQATAEERDTYRDQVHSLICKVHDLETSLAACAPNNVKKEREEEVGEDLKRLYEEAKREAEELRRERDTLLAAGQGKPGPAQPKEENRVSDEMALQVDALLRALDQSNRERDELGCKVECMERERAALTPQCERLQSDLSEARRELQERVAATQSTVSPPGGSGTVAGPAGSAQNNQQGAASTSQQGHSLRELRRTVGRLLVSYVPALDLEQVNYDCNVIDEILEQVLTDMESMGTM